MTGRSKPPRFVVVARNEVLADVDALAVHGPEVVDAAVSIVDALAHGRLTGKALGERSITGDLRGLARVKFVPEHRPQRFRLLYRRLDDTMREIVAIGPRDEHAIYRLALGRIRDEPGRSR